MRHILAKDFEDLTETEQERAVRRAALDVLNDTSFDDMAGCVGEDDESRQMLAEYNELAEFIRKHCPLLHDRAREAAGVADYFGHDFGEGIPQARILMEGSK